MPPQFRTETLPRARRKWWPLPCVLAALALFSFGPAPAQTNSPNAATDAAALPPTCTHCRARRGSIDALREQLPSQWTLRLEREPVFSGEVLTVQAGIEHAQTLLLVHGLGQNGFTDWLPVMRGLAERYHVIALDLPGYGYSSSPAGKYSPTNYSRVLRWLLARHAKGGPVILAGHSMGAAVSLRFASEYPDQVSKLVLADAAGILHRTAFVKHTASLPLSVEALPGLLKAPVARIKDFGNAVVERIFNLPGDPTAALRGNDFAWAMALRDRSDINAGLALVDEDFSVAVHTLKVPTQIIWGEADAIAPLRTGQTLARRLPRAQLHTLPGVGHLPQEHEIERYAALLDKVLESDPVPAARAAQPSARSTRDLLCKGQVDRQYSGHYREIRIEGCNAVRLTDVTAERILIRDSIVQMLHTSVRSDGVALDVSNSELIATASEVRGSVAIRTDDSRLDLAGVTLVASETAVDVQSWSRLIASISEMKSPAFSGYWHGSQELERGGLVPARGMR